MDALYRALFEQSIDCVLITAPDGAVVRANPAACRAFRLDEEALRHVGRAGRVVDDADLRAFLARCEQTGAAQGRLRLRRSDGSTFPAEVSSSTMRGSDGERYTCVIFRDVTERERAEVELALVTRLYAVLSRANEAIVRAHAEQPLFEEVCRIAAEEGGFPLAWVGIREGNQVVPHAAHGSAVGYLREVRVEVEGSLGIGPTGTAVREGHPVINEDFGVTPGTWPWRQATLRHGLRASAAFPLREAGRVVGALTLYADRPGAFTAAHVRLLEALCADLSYALDALQQERLRSEAERALRESEQQLREADRRKDEFLSMLSHELRNPLAPIRNSVLVLRQADPGSEQAIRARGVIERQACHLTRLVDDLLDVTRIARGKIQLRRERVDLRELVLRASEDFRLIMDERGIQLRAAVPAGPAWVEADPTRITQVIGNLLHNAAKFSAAGDEVTLSLEVCGGSAAVRVRDTGAGIDPKLLPDVFEPFVQGQRTLARTEGGLGLGLALVKGIVELHGGTVEARSAGSGKGAELRFALPLRREAGAPAAAGDEAPPAAHRRVLVVDDNLDAADSLSDLLQVVGHSVEVAHDGPDALAKVRANPPEVVLCDIGLPGMDGYELARALRRETALGSALLIALSGYTQPEDRQRAREAGFDAHMAKPIDLDQLFQVLAAGRPACSLPAR